MTIDRAHLRRLAVIARDTELDASMTELAQALDPSTVLELLDDDLITRLELLADAWQETGSALSSAHRCARELRQLLRERG
jgi:hypothetical protein